MIHVSIGNASNLSHENKSIQSAIFSPTPSNFNNSSFAKSYFIFFKNSIFIRLI